MVEPLELRRAFAVFLGHGRFRKFVRQGFRKGRLRYWQEREWRRFNAAHPEFGVGLDELAVALRTGPLPGEGWENEGRFFTIAAAVAGAIIAGMFDIVVVCACYFHFLQLNQPTGGAGADFPDLTPLFYGGFALCVAPLSMLYGAAIGVRWAQSRKLASEVATAPEPRSLGDGPTSRP